MKKNILAVVFGLFLSFLMIFCLEVFSYYARNSYIKKIFDKPIKLEVTPGVLSDYDPSFVAELKQAANGVKYPFAEVKKLQDAAYKRHSKEGIPFPVTVHADEPIGENTGLRRNFRYFENDKTLIFNNVYRTDEASFRVPQSQPKTSADYFGLVFGCSFYGALGLMTTRLLPSYLTNQAQK